MPVRPADDDRSVRSTAAILATVLIGAAATVIGAVTGVGLYLQAFSRTIDGPVLPAAWLLLIGLAIVVGGPVGAVLGYVCARFRLYRWGAAPLASFGALIGLLVGLGGENGIGALVSGVLAGLLGHYLYCIACLVVPGVNTVIRSALGAAKVREAALVVVVLAAAVPLFQLDQYVSGGNERAVTELQAETLALTGLTGAVTDEGRYSRQGPRREGCDWIGRDYVEMVDGVDRRPDAERLAGLLEDDGWLVTRLEYERTDGRTLKAVRGRDGVLVILRSNRTWFEVVTGTCAMPFLPRTDNSQGRVVDAFAPG